MSSYLKNSKLETDDQDYFENGIFANSVVFKVSYFKDRIQLFYSGFQPDYSCTIADGFIDRFKKYFSKLEEYDKRNITPGYHLDIPNTPYIILYYNEKCKRKPLSKSAILEDWYLA